jgi:8-oxo-dGTP diphosphatase
MSPSQEEKDFIQSYNSENYPHPAVSVDIVVFTILDTDLKILLIKRGEHPYKEHWALPGGFVRIGDSSQSGESLDQAAYRELHEETSLSPNALYLEQLHTFGAVERDPRMRVITVAYYALIRPDLAPLIHSGSDASDAQWISHSLLSETELAFDHSTIIQKAAQHIQQKINHSTIAFELVPPTFTVSELRSVHEAIKTTSYDPSNFRRKFKSMLQDGIIQEAPGKRITISRPAKVYSFVR